MAVIAPSALVEGAVRQPLAYGLFSALTLRPATADRWEAGVEFEVGTCGPVQGIGQAQCDPDDPVIGLPLDLDRNVPAVGEASVITVYGYFSCGPVGWPVEKAEEFARTHLLSREEARVEQALWTGDLGNMPNFSDDGVDITPTAGTPIDVVAGIALLEQAIAVEYGSTGVIHMTRAHAVAGLARNALITSGGRLTTALGTPVVAGAGYPGTGPENAAATNNSLWMFASPALFGYRSEIFSASSRAGDLFDRARNDLYATAQRQYLMGYDPCPNGVSAVLADLD